MEFIGRREELDLLENEYSRRYSMVAIYGRRRVGKTTLIRKFIEDKPSIYFLCTEETSKANLERFSDSASPMLGFKGARFDSWYNAIDAVSRNGKKVIVIDEFPYLVKSDKSIPSQFQNICDTLLSGREAMLILCGSFKTMMEDYVLNRESPLYGRRTALLNVRPLDFLTIRDAFPEKGTRQVIEEYACHGGVPKYMEVFDLPDLRDNLSRYVINRNGVLYEEPSFLLGGELRNPVSYMAIMRCIAKGNVHLKDIAGRMEMQSNSLTPYLGKLAELGFISRSVPPTEPNPERSRKGTYVFADLFMEFWFRFVYPYRGEIEMGHADEALRHFDNHFIDGYVSFVFEEICRQYIWSIREKTGVHFTRVGSIGNPDELDIVAIDPENKEAFVGECKYLSSPVTLGVLNTLVEKCGRKKELSGYRIRYGLFSVSGFDENLAKAAEKDGILLVNLE